MRRERPRLEIAQRIGRADRDLKREDDGGRDRRAAEPGTLATMTPRLSARRYQRDAHDRGDVAMQHRDQRGTTRRKVDSW